ncbi:MAG: tyrosine-protein phosphatase [Kiritimatiellae bacterium]|nr:tyrosine-protein phosphatase [Kiritimatiellia bacterium]
MKRIPAAFAVFLFAAASALFAGESGIRLVEPAEGAVVPLLRPAQKMFVLMPRDARVNVYTNEAFRRALRDGGEKPAKVGFAWKGSAPAGDGPAFAVEVRRLPDGKVFFRGETDHHHIEADGFEIAREWEWTVRARGGASATGRFRTEDLAPRLVDGGAVPNVRDLGGRIGLDGRRVRQGLVFRSAGLNSNASDVFYTRDELLEASDDPAALLAREGEVSNLVSRMRADFGDSAAPPLVSAELPREWTLFRPEQEAFDADGERALAALTAVPETFCGARAEILRENAEGDWILHGRAKAKGPAVLFAAIDASDDGWLSLGCGADWYWTLRVNGEIAFDRAGGNEKLPINADDWTFPVRVRKGANLLSVVLKPGSGGWRWCCKTAPAVPVATLVRTLADNGTDRLDRIFHVLKCIQPGETRIDDKNRSLWLETLGVRTDIDLRSDGEVYGMEGSPLGPTVAWTNISSSAYAGLQEEWGRKQFAKVFRVFLDPANYPIDFHCIAGQDRTGAVAFVLNALLGVEEDQLRLDWEVTAFHNRSTDFCHGKLFDKLLRGFDRWPGDTVNERVEAWTLDLGFTPEDVAKFRGIMLEPR